MPLPRPRGQERPVPELLYPCCSSRPGAPGSLSPDRRCSLSLLRQEPEAWTSAPKSAHGQGQEAAAALSQHRAAPAREES